MGTKTKRGFVIGQLTVEELVGRLSFPEEELQIAILEQAKLFMEAAGYRIRKMKSRQRAEAELESLRADLGLAYRKKKASDKKLTEKFIAELVGRDVRVRGVQVALDDAKRAEEFSKLLLESFQHRREMLKLLTSFAFAEGDLKVRAPSLQDSLRKKKEKLRREFPPEEE